MQLLENVHKGSKFTLVERTGEVRVSESYWDMIQFSVYVKFDAYEWLGVEIQNYAAAERMEWAERMIHDL